MAPKIELTSDHLVILPNPRVTVDRSPVSFPAVLFVPASIGFPVPTYLPVRGVCLVTTHALWTFSDSVPSASGTTSEWGLRRGLG
jgi:hypothetical protein